MLDDSPIVDLPTHLPQTVDDEGSVILLKTLPASEPILLRPWAKRIVLELTGEIPVLSRPTSTLVLQAPLILPALRLRRQAYTRTTLTRLRRLALIRPGLHGLCAQALI